MAIRRVVSIEIGLSRTKICETDYQKHNPKVYKCSVFDTPEHMIEDGYIRDKIGFAEVLRVELKRAGISCQNLLFSVASNRIISREVTLPLAKEKLIPKIIEAEKDEYFPMDISEYEIAYTILEKIEEKSQLRLMVYAVPTNLLKNYFNLATELKSRIVSIDFIGNSIFQWLKIHGKEEPVSLYLQMNEQNSLITIMEKKALSLQRNLNIGTDIMTDAVLESKGRDSMSAYDANQMLQKDTYIKTNFDSRDFNEAGELSEEELHIRQELCEEVTSSLRPFVANISRVIEFYTAKAKTMHITTIQLLGHGEKFKGLDVLISNELGVQVIPITKLEGAVYTKAAESAAEFGQELISCLGASIQTIQYIRPVFETDKKDDTGIRTMMILLAFVVLASGLLIFMSGKEYRDEVKRGDKLEQQIAESQYIIDIYNEHTLLQEARTEIEAMDTGNVSTTDALLEIMAELENKLPSGTVIHSLSSTDQALMLNVSCSSKAEAEKLLLQMQEISYFESIQLSGIAETEDDYGMVTVSFTLTCNYPVAEEGASNE